MAALPLFDHAGESLDAYTPVASDDAFAELDPAIPLPLSLAVVRHEGRVLMVFNPWRAYWELPGGMLDPGETPRQAAIRELHEETGIRTDVDALDAAAVVEFTLRSPDRREYAAVFRTELDEVPALRTNEEATGFLWWDPVSEPASTMGLLDAEIARRCCQQPWPAHRES